MNIDGPSNKALFVVETSANLLIEVLGLMYLDSTFFLSPSQISTRSEVTWDPAVMYITSVK